MKHNSLTLLLMAAMLLTGVPTARAQKQGSTAEGKVKFVLHMAGNQTFECTISQLDSITFVGEDLIIEEEHEWVDLGLPSGTLWATCNVGASSPEEYGDYFAWGETEPKNEYSWSTYKYCKGSYNTLTKYCSQSDYGYNGFTDELTELEPADDAATVNWGNGWQMPSHYQTAELFNNKYTITTWTTQKGIYGFKITSKNNGKNIFLPADGNSNGYYWSCSLNESCSYIAYNLHLDPDGIYESSSFRNDSCTVRPVRVQTR